MGGAVRSELPPVKNGPFAPFFLFTLVPFLVVSLQLLKPSLNILQTLYLPFKISNALGKIAHASCTRWTEKRRFIGHVLPFIVFCVASSDLASRHTLTHSASR